MDAQWKTLRHSKESVKWPSFTPRLPLNRSAGPFRPRTHPRACCTRKGCWCLWRFVSLLQPKLHNTNMIQNSRSRTISATSPPSICSAVWVRRLLALPGSRLSVARRVPQIPLVILEAFPSSSILKRETGIGYTTIPDLLPPGSYQVPSLYPHTKTKPTDQLERCHDVLGLPLLTKRLFIRSCTYFRTEVPHTLTDI